MLFADGVPLEEISGLVGDSSTATARAIYLHLLPNGKLAAASKADRFFAETGSYGSGTWVRRPSRVSRR